MCENNFIERIKKICPQEKIICITNRALCPVPLEEKISFLLSQGFSKIILREKDLSEEEYKELLQRVLQTSTDAKEKIIVHNFYKIALEEKINALHVPLEVLKKMSDIERKSFATLGASCHSVEDALEAQKLGCTYILAGHIFPTDCKKGLAPRGLEFLQSVCSAVKIPVYALGGINERNATLTLENGAGGIAMMSALMR